MDGVLEVNPDFWRGKRVFVTGHTGFKGAWLVLLLERLGARIGGYSRAELDGPNLFSLARVSELCDDRRGDVRDLEGLRASLEEFAPEVVIHLAAQSLVRRSYSLPIETFEVNVVGTANVLESLRTCPSVLAAVLVTTDKVYENDESGRAFVETMPLGGYDPYSASKAAAELVVSSYRRSFFSDSPLGLATARAGNVIGGADFAPDRLFPDLMRAFSKGEPAHIRNPASTRPFEHVLEPLFGYLRLAERLASGDRSVRCAFNFGPEASEIASVERVARIACDVWGDGAEILLGDSGGPHEAKLLGLDIELARSVLGYVPHFGLEEAVRRTVAFYRDMTKGAAARELVVRDIEYFLGRSS